METPADPLVQADTLQGLLAGHPRVAHLLDRLRRHHPASFAHSVRVGRVLLAMQRQASASLGPAETALAAGLLHDIGKLQVPAETLNSPDGLDAAGRALIRAHPEAGAALLAEAGFPPDLVEVVRGHHERWQGGGYPTGRPSSTLPRLARAVSVADALVAMVEPGRRYRTPMRRDAALAELATSAGQHFDPEATALLLATIDAPQGELASLFSA
jgi:putative nucleotidyltransferase with HDIG domain